MYNYFKKIIHLVFPPFVFVIFNKISKKSQTYTPLPMQHHHNNRMIILGNGPSLNNSWIKYRDEIILGDCTVVNHFATSSIYHDIHPSYYIMADPAFFMADENDINEKVKETINAIICKTTWNLCMVFPLSAQKSYIAKALSRNNNISILFYNNMTFSIPNGMSYCQALDKNAIGPPAQTVLNVCVWASLYWGYEETYLIGADTSFLADERIDQETNELYTLDTHFYSTDEENANNRRNIPTKFHEELISVATALKGYWDLREYAEWKGLKVYNASEYSWIDAFDRKKLK